VIGGDKQSLSLGFLKKALFNEEPSHPMRQNYLFQTAFAIIYTLKPTIWHWTKIAKTFSVKKDLLRQKPAIFSEIWQQ
jgi:hypothetical protein